MSRISDLNQDNEVMEQLALETLSYPTDMVNSRSRHASQSMICKVPCCSSELSLGDDELGIAVTASGLNFRDVMVAMSAIPDTTVGLEARGVVPPLVRID